MEKRWELEKRKMPAHSGFSGRACVSAAEECGPITGTCIFSRRAGSHQPAKSRTCRREGQLTGREWGDVWQSKYLGRLPPDFRKEGAESSTNSVVADGRDHEMDYSRRIAMRIW